MDELECYLLSCLGLSAYSVSVPDVISVAFGSMHCLVLTAQGTVFSFGTNHFGQLGIENLDCNLENPHNVSGLPSRVISVACGPTTSAALMENGCVYMWGDNSHGACGPVKIEKLTTPIRVPFPECQCEACDSNTTVTQIACSSHHTLALTASHQVWFWGTQYGKPRTTPMKIACFSNKLVISIACGYDHNLAVVLANTNQSIFKTEESRNGQNARESAVVLESSKPSDHACSLKVLENSECAHDVTSAVQNLLSDLVECISNNKIIMEYTQFATTEHSFGSNAKCFLKHSNSFLDLEIAKEYLEMLTTSRQCSDEIKVMSAEDQLIKKTDVWDSVREMRDSYDDFDASLKSSMEGTDDASSRSDNSLDLSENHKSSLIDLDLEKGVIRAGSAKSLLEMKKLSRYESESKHEKKCDIQEVSRLCHKNQESMDETSLSNMYTEVWTWGSGLQGQLGNGKLEDSLEPSCVFQLKDQGVVRVFSGGFHSLALTLDRRLFTWGSNSRGQLGHSFKQFNSPSPRQVQ